jgi:hypothetical protein
MYEEILATLAKTGNNKAEAARLLKIAPSTLKDRLSIIQRNGGNIPVRTRAEKPVPVPTRPQKHCVIPDVQAKGGVPLDHLKWAGEYIADKRPDTIICIGDFADMPSLSSYDRGKASAENKRYQYDLEATHKAMELLMTPIVKAEKYKPRLFLTLGNHEQRIIRYGDDNPALEGHVSIDDLGYEKWGWEVHPFLEVVTVDGVEYVHYVTTGVMGRAAGSASAMMRARQQSCTQGHSQYYDMYVHPKTQKRALMAGTFYQHDEGYLGPQGNNYKRHIIMKHEVQDGLYDIMEVSLEYLRKRYA